MRIYGRKTSKEYARKFYFDIQYGRQLLKSGGEINVNLDINYDNFITVRS